MCAPVSEVCASAINVSRPPSNRHCRTAPDARAFLTTHAAPTSALRTRPPPRAEPRRRRRARSRQLDVTPRPGPLGRDGPRRAPSLGRASSSTGSAIAGGASHLGAGPAIVISFLLTGVACGFAALCYGEFAAMVPVAGSAYTYAYAALGELVAWIIGSDLIIEYAVGNVAVAVSWSGHFHELLRTFSLELPAWLVTDYRTAAQAGGALADGASDASCSNMCLVRSRASRSTARAGQPGVPPRAIRVGTGTGNPRAATRRLRRGGQLRCRQPLPPGSRRRPSPCRWDAAGRTARSAPPHHQAPR
ncbi:MAG TPA: amino acid permease [Gemmatimonadales bacterium]